MGVILRAELLTILNGHERVQGCEQIHTNFSCIIIK